MPTKKDNSISQQAKGLQIAHSVQHDTMQFNENSHCLKIV